MASFLKNFEYFSFSGAPAFLFIPEKGFFVLYQESTAYVVDKISNDFFLFSVHEGERPLKTAFFLNGD